MHPQAYEFVQRVLADRPHQKRVVELGSRSINGSVRDLFNGAKYVGVDIAPGPGVDVIADAALYYPEAGDEPDCVVCCEVLEHTPRAAETIVRNAYAMLKPGGLFICTAAADPRAPHSGHDGGKLRIGEPYRNVTLADLAGWLEPFAVKHVEHDEAHGDVRGWGVK